MKHLNLLDSIRRKKGGLRAFTIVELAVVITVIAILVAISYFGFSTWRDRVAETELKSDLSAVAAAMDSARNWSKGGYPELADGVTFDGTEPTKAIFTQSEHVILTYYEGDNKSFCIDAVSKARPSIAMFYDSNNSSKEPMKGTCYGGEGYTPNLAQTVLVYDTRQSDCSGTIQLPITQPTSAPGSIINWGDGSTGTLTSSLQSHTYSTPGRYLVTYEGPISVFNSGSVAVANRGCLKELRQWGSGAAPTAVAFFYSTNLTYAAEPPHTVTDMSRMFCYIPGFNQPVGHWDVSRVTNMQNMFRGTSYNHPLNDWDVGNVTNMSEMFMDARDFNQPIGNWNMRNTTTINQMFYNAKAFNQPLNSWDTQDVVLMSNVFDGASAFNQPLSSWNTSKVTTLYNMFSGASSFNQPLNSWDVSKVTTIRGMFGNASSFNQPLNNWDVSNVVNMSNAFLGSAFNQSINNWNTSKVTDMALMFYSANAFNQPLNNWDVSKVTNMSNMFQGAAAFNQPLNNWNMSNVLSMSGMFAGAQSFNQPINNWNISKVTNIFLMFSGATNFNQPLNNWDTSKVTNMGATFQHAASFNQNLSSWNVSSVADKPPVHFSLGATSWTQPKPVW